MPSTLGRLYERIYSYLCGVHPKLFPWHFQWLAVKDLYVDLKKEAENTSGIVLDVGCGEKPYKSWFLSIDQYIGIDISNNQYVDYKIEKGKPWPIDNDSINVVFCSQVFEHVNDLPLIMAEINRVLKPGGAIIASVPFIYYEHGAPNDYWRFSKFGLLELFKDYDVKKVKLQGGVGSTIGLLLLGFLEIFTTQNKLTRFIKALLLPIWIGFSAIVNIIGVLIDHLDRTNVFYSNVLIVVEKPTNT